METFLQLILAPTLVVAAVVFLARSLVSQWLSKNIEAYKHKLEGQTAAELERLRAQLAIVAVEHQVRFSRLHDRQAEIIATIFAKLDHLHGAFREWTYPGALGQAPNMIKRRDRAIDQFNKFVQYYYPHAIWLDEDTCAAINGILDQLRTPYYDFVVNTDQNGHPRDRDAWLKIYNKINREIPAARTLLDKRFRQILGVSSAGIAATPVGRTLPTKTQGADGSVAAEGQGADG